MKPLELKVIWPNATRQDNPAAATFADLRITVGDEPASTYVDLDDGSECDHVDQPMLYLAEWLVENWWPLLWEPEKSDESEQRDDAAFFSRHSLAAAAHGFALPDVRFVPVGDDLHVFAIPHVAEYARVRFTRGGNAFVSRAAVEGALVTFVDEVCARFPYGVGDALKDAWRLIRQTGEPAAEFCRLKGALGLSPYVTHPKIEAALDRASELLSSRQILDLCQTTTADDFVRSAQVAGLLGGMLENAVDQIDLTPLAVLPIPSDVHSAPAYRRGYSAASKLRSEFGVGDTTIEGATTIFEALHIDWRSGARIDLKGFACPFSGAIDRRENDGRLALVHEAPSSRRFAAARATYFFWAGEENGRRLLTNAVTRDQQASRAFAAEMLVPQGLLIANARKARISWDQVAAIAEEAMVAPDVVRHQATNGGLQIVQ